MAFFHLTAGKVKMDLNEHCTGIENILKRLKKGVNLAPSQKSLSLLGGSDFEEENSTACLVKESVNNLEEKPQGNAIEVPEPLLKKIWQRLLDFESRFDVLEKV